MAYVLPMLEIVEKRLVVLNASFLREKSESEGERERFKFVDYHSLGILKKFKLIT
jgi:hypothetical protein